MSRTILALMVVLPAIVAAAAKAQAPSALARSAAVSAPAGKPGLAGKWTCVSLATIEIAPVSHDTRDRADAWLIVYRDRGEIIAAERVDAAGVEQLRRLPCGGPDSDLGGVARIG